MMETVVHRHNIKAAIGKGQAFYISRKKLRGEAITAGTLVRASNRSAREIDAGYTRSATRQNLSHHAGTATNL
jgi:hypothetical protein